MTRAELYTPVRDPTALGVVVPPGIGFALPLSSQGIALRGVLRKPTLAHRHAQDP